MIFILWIMRILVGSVLIPYNNNSRQVNMHFKKRDSWLVSWLVGRSVSWLVGWESSEWLNFNFMPWHSGYLRHKGMTFFEVQLELWVSYWLSIWAPSLQGWCHRAFRPDSYHSCTFQMQVFYWMFCSFFKCVI